METKKLLDEWLQKVHILHRCNAQLAARYDARGRNLGLVATILTAFVASSIFTSLTQSDKTIWLVITGLFSISTIVVSAANQYLKYPELSLHYNQAVDLYGKLRREIEIALHETDTKEITEESFKKLSNEWAELEKKVPPVPTDIYQTVKQEIKDEKLSDRKKNQSLDNKRDENI